MTEALIIDDNRTTADALSQMLNVLDLKARVAYGASAAVKILAGGFTPAFICLDINMPGMNGLEMLTYLRREPHLTAVPVFVITSDDQPETHRNVMRLGANLLIVKPATIDVLQEGLRQVGVLK